MRPPAMLALLVFSMAAGAAVLASLQSASTPPATDQENKTMPLMSRD